MMANPTATQWALACGAFQLAAGFFLLCSPAGAATGFLRGFPRNALAGRFLAVVAWVFTAWATYLFPLDFIAPIQRPHVLVPLTAVLALLTCWWMPEMLSCRATAAFLMLFPCPLFIALRAHPSAWRLVYVTFSYLAIVAGMVVMFSPYHMRRAFYFLADHPLARKTTGAVFLAAGLLSSVIALAVIHNN